MSWLSFLLGLSLGMLIGAFVWTYLTIRERERRDEQLERARRYRD